MRRTIGFILFFLIIPCTQNSLAGDYYLGVEKIRYYPVYAWRKSQYEGFARELLDTFAASYGHNFVYRPFTVSSLTEAFVDGKVVLKFPDNPYWAKDRKVGKNIVYSNGALTYIDGVMVRKDKLGKGRSALKKLGTIKGFTPWEYLDDINAGKLVVESFGHTATLLTAIQDGSVDGGYFNFLVARDFIEKNPDKGFSDIVFDKDLPHTRSEYALSSIKNPEIVTQFNEYLEKNQADITAMKLKYNVLIGE